MENGAATTDLSGTTSLPRRLPRRSSLSSGLVPLTGDGEDGGNNNFRFDPGRTRGDLRCSARPGQNAEGRLNEAYHLGNCSGRVLSPAAESHAVENPERFVPRTEMPESVFAVTFARRSPRTQAMLPAAPIFRDWKDLDLAALRSMRKLPLARLQATRIKTPDNLAGGRSGDHGMVRAGQLGWADHVGGGLPRRIWLHGRR